MKVSKLFWGLILIAAAGIWHEPFAQGQGASCYVSPSEQKTFIFVRELDQDGNPLGQLGSGWINQGGELPIFSQTGRISISYQQVWSDKLVLMDPTGCSDGDMISVP